MGTATSVISVSSPTHHAAGRPLVLQVPDTSAGSSSSGRAPAAVQIGVQLRGGGEREVTIRPVTQGDSRKARIFLNAELAGLRRRVDQLEKENRRLREELQQTQSEQKGTSRNEQKDEEETLQQNEAAEEDEERFLASGRVLHRVQNQFDLYQENKEQEVRDLQAELTFLRKASSTPRDDKSRLSTPAVEQRRSSGCSSPVPFPLPYTPLENLDSLELDVPPHTFLPQNRRSPEWVSKSMHLIYILLGKDMEHHMDIFREEYEEDLRLKVHPQEVTFELVSSLEFHERKWRRRAAARATAAIAIVGHDFDAEIVDEVPGSKLSTVIVVGKISDLLQPGSYHGLDKNMQQDGVNLAAGLLKGARILNSDEDKVAEVLKDELSHLLINHNVDSGMQLSSYKRYCYGHGASPYVSSRQAMLQSFYGKLGKGIAFAKYTDKLGTYVGSRQSAPLVVSGGPGMGATCLLLRLVDSLRESGQMILSHFVTSPRLSHPGCVIASLVEQCLQHVPEGTIDSNTLFSNFGPSIRKLASAHPCGIVIVIDSIDRVPHFDAHLPFLWHDLPPKMHVIVSLHEDRCPETWIQFPHLQLEPPAYHSLQQVLNNRSRWRRLQLERPLDMRFLMRCHSGARCCPLYVSVFVSALKYFSTTESIPELFAKLVQCSDVPTLYEAVLCRIQSKHLITEHALSLICTSKEGMTHSELLQLLSLDSWEELYPTLDALSRTLIVADEDGFLWIPFADARKVVRKFCGKADSAREKIVAYFDGVFRIRGPSVRVVDEMAYVLQGGPVSESFLTHPVVFSLLYSRGRACELHHLWQMYVGGSRSEMSALYFSSFESHLSGCQMQWGALEISLLYAALGRFLDAEGGTEQDSHLAYHRALSICERDVHPDHLAVGLFLQLISELHDQCGKCSLSRAFLKQSLQIYSHHLPPSHPIFCRGLESLSTLYRTHGKTRLAALVSERLNAVQATAHVKEAEAGQAAALKKAQATLGDMHPITLQARLNLAILYSRQGKMYDAQSLYESSLEMCRKAYGDEHVLVAKILRNFAIFHKEQGDFAEATRLYCTSEAIFRKSADHTTCSKKTGSKSAQSNVKIRLKTVRLSAKSTPPIFH